MRRKRMTPFQPVMRRSGVIASVMQRKRSVQTPVSFVMSLERIRAEVAGAAPPT